MEKTRHGEENALVPRYFTITGAEGYAARREIHRHGHNRYV